MLDPCWYQLVKEEQWDLLAQQFQLQQAMEKRKKRDVKPPQKRTKRKPKWTLQDSESLLRYALAGSRSFPPLHLFKIFLEPFLHHCNLAASRTTNTTSTTGGLVGETTRRQEEEEEDESRDASCSPLSLDGDDDDDTRTPQWNLMHAAAAAAGRPEMDTTTIKLLLACFPRHVEEMDDQWRLPLHVACAAQQPPHNFEMIQLLLQAYPQAASRIDSTGRLPLHSFLWALSSSSSSSSSPSTLLSQSSSSSSSSSSPSSPSSSSSFCQLETTLSLLMQAYPPALSCDATFDGGTPLHCSTLGLHHYQKEEDAPFVAWQCLLRQCPFAAQVANHWNRLPLHEACVRKHASAICALLQVHPQGAAQQSVDQGRFPLHDAMDVGGSSSFVFLNDKTTTCLIQAYPPAAWIGATRHENQHDAVLPLQVAVSSSHLALSSLLSLPRDRGGGSVAALVRAHPEAIFSLLPTKKLVVAAKHGHKDDGDSILSNILQTAFPQGVQAHAQQKGRFPLHVACQYSAYNQDNLLLRLLTQLGQDWTNVWGIPFVDHGHDDGYHPRITAGSTPLHVALSQPRCAPEIAHFLVASDLTALAVQNVQGQTPLHLVVQHAEAASLELMHFLFQAHPPAARLADRQGRLPLHLACQRFVERVPFVVPQVVAMYPNALRHADGDGQLPFVVACLTATTAAAAAKTKTISAHDTPMREMDRLYFLLREAPEVLKGSDG